MFSAARTGRNYSINLGGKEKSLCKAARLEEILL